MAEKGWTAQAATAAGIAAGTGAAQLGLGYGLGVIAWPVTAIEGDSAWLGSLGWATWITASATVLGAVIAGRLRPERADRWRGLWRFALALASALGALVSLALVALPARAAVRADTVSPQLVAGGYALAGLLAGLVVAFWAVSSGPVAANLIGTALWLWALAVAGVVAELASGRDFETYLTSWQFAESVSPVQYGGIYWPSALLTLVAAFIIGSVAAAPAAWRGEVGLGTAISGAVGPLLVAFSFLTLAPQLTEVMGPLESAYLIAPYAALAGLGGSALAVGIAQGRHGRLDRPRAAVPEPVDASPAGERPPVKEAPPAGETPAVKDALPVKATATGRATPATPRATVPDKPTKPAVVDPEIAAAARQTGRAPAKRRNGNGETTRSTITPPPASPTVARINPDEPEKRP
ncbi:Hansenula MRAKII killer toxin-resistant protein 1 [Actinoplanes sp. NEAU-A12]|uniref:Hansenula MRAKII killer toxin-resistant protein 1 n=1 Tax=Actinoplanes sandaracinus TaxID=3045177 RepID=A0ABT6WH49_9ACTN|nr:Hansenula MRAKII killer toxin-resistant protein 1 [Actinoplanes sandaracinus]MDI6099040.1 Hansenula MRAKII killer toxin-resistant protein 1 [Actinoplanes sandaracinus]MDI6102935.1 Hansenula MRAKII killer toxin-resistant protein 1 [Actinoplanes sandaracinus]